MSYQRLFFSGQRAKFSFLGELRPLSTLLLSESIVEHCLTSSEFKVQLGSSFPISGAQTLDYFRKKNRPYHIMRPSLPLGQSDKVAFRAEALASGSKFGLITDDKVLCV
jgi:hypothetical protein